VTAATVTVSSVLQLTEDEANEIRKLLGLEEGKDDGEVVVDLCPLCAGPIWRSTETGKPRAVVARLSQEAVCPPCNEVAHLHPTIFSWIVDVLRGQRTLAVVASRATPP
jgi:hypothetical protein